MPFQFPYNRYEDPIRKAVEEMEPPQFPVGEHNINYFLNAAKFLAPQTTRTISRLFGGGYEKKGLPKSEAALADLLPDEPEMATLDLMPGGEMAAPAITMFAKRPEAFKQLIKNMERVAPSEAKSFARKYSKDIPRSVPKVSSELIEDYTKAMASDWGTYGIENEARMSLGRRTARQKLGSLAEKYELKDEPALNYWHPDQAREYAKEARKRGQTWQPQWHNPVEIVHKAPMTDVDEVLEFVKKHAKELDKISRGGKYGGGLHISQSFPELSTIPESIVPPLAWEYAMFEPTIFPPRAAYKPRERRHVRPFYSWLKHSGQYEPVLTPAYKGQGYLGSIPEMKGSSAFNLSSLQDYPRYRRIEYRPFSSSEKLNPEVAENFVLLQNMLDMARRDPQKWPEYAEALPKIYKEAIEPRAQAILKQQEQYVPEGIKREYSPFANGMLEPEYYQPLPSRPGYVPSGPEIDPRIREQVQENIERMYERNTQGLDWLPPEGSDADYAVNWFLRHHPRMDHIPDQTLREHIQRLENVYLSHPNAIPRDQAIDIARGSARNIYDAALEAMGRGRTRIRHAPRYNPAIEDLLDAATQASSTPTNRRGMLDGLFPDNETADVMTELKRTGRLRPAQTTTDFRIEPGPNTHTLNEMLGLSTGDPLRGIAYTGQQIWNRLMGDRATASRAGTIPGTLRGDPHAPGIYPAPRDLGLSADDYNRMIDFLIEQNRLGRYAPVE